MMVSNNFKVLLVASSYKHKIINELKNMSHLNIEIFTNHYLN